MNGSLQPTEAATKTLLHIECTAVNSRLLRKIMKQRKDVAILTGHYDDETMAFIRNQHPEYIVVNIDALGNNVNQIYHSLVMLNEIHTGKLIVSGYDISSIRVLTSWMPKIAFVDFPLNNQSLLETIANKEHTEAA